MNIPHAGLNPFFSTTRLAVPAPAMHHQNTVRRASDTEFVMVDGASGGRPKAQTTASQALRSQSGVFTPKKVVFINGIQQRKLDLLNQRFVALSIDEADIEESFIRGSGSGGQKINKTNSCVQLKHIPTGTIITCQDGRSQAQNRYLARVWLADRIAKDQKQKRLAEGREQHRKNQSKRDKTAKKKQKETQMREKHRYSRTRHKNALRKERT